jgi:hypothetical protein
VLVRRYDARDRTCPCHPCWAPGLYAHMAAAGVHGLRSTDHVTRECLTRAYRGCPDPLPEPQHDFGKRRRLCARCGQVQSAP